MGSTILDDKRFCSKCGSHETYITKHGNAQWYYRNLDGLSGWICSRCNNKYITNPKWKPIWRARRLNFKGTYLYFPQNVRTGICAWCHRTVASGQIKRTDTHHIKYDINNPLAYTVELCHSCHQKEGIRLGQIAPWKYR